MPCDDPLSIVSFLGEDELEKLRVEVETYVELEKKKAGRFLSFWESLLEIVNFDLSRLRIVQTNLSSVHKAVDDDIKGLIGGKSLLDLQNLLLDVRKTISVGNNDNEYWELMAKEVNYEIARKTFYDAHDKILEKENEVVREMRTYLKEHPQVSETSSALDEGVDVSRVHDDELEESEERMERTDEIDLPERKYTWQDKYRPRKPRYFNRVN